MEFISHGKMYVPDSAVRDFVNRGYREGRIPMGARTVQEQRRGGATRIEFGIDGRLQRTLACFVASR